MIVLFCFMLAGQVGRTPPSARDPLVALSGELQRLTQEVAASGHIVGLSSSPSNRVSVPPQIAPGAPPLLAFRYYDGQQRHRFNGTELMLDDAGH